MDDLRHISPEEQSAAEFAIRRNKVSEFFYHTCVATTPKWSCAVIHPQSRSRWDDSELLLLIPLKSIEKSTAFSGVLTFCYRTLIAVEI